MNKLLILFSLFLLFSCQKQKHNSFYYWKTSGKLNSTEKSILKDSKVEKIYLKMFDVVWNENLQMPVNTLTIQSVEESLNVLEVIPTIFIKNDIFSKSSDIQLNELSVKVNNMINSISSGNFVYNEIQFDCDWTESTKNRFFKFLKDFEKISGKQLSVTLRLHQIKFQSIMGIPPVEKATLMFYNMGDLSQSSETNSILNLEKSNKYVAYLKKYPIHLDVALPIFSWSVLIRNGKVSGLFPDILEKDLSDTALFAKMKYNYYFVRKAHLIHGKYLETADIIRFESSNLQNVKAAIHQLKEFLPNEERDIILYNLDSLQIQNFGYENITSIFNSFN
jgi:hypothetical protein